MQQTKLSLFSISLSSIKQLLDEARKNKYLKEFSMHLPVPGSMFLSISGALLVEAPPLAFCDGYIGKRLISIYHYGDFYMILEEDEKVRASIMRDITFLLDDIKPIACWENGKRADIMALLR